MTESVFCIILCTLFGAALCVCCCSLAPVDGSLFGLCRQKGKLSDSQWKAVAIKAMFSSPFAKVTARTCHLPLHSPPPPFLPCSTSPFLPSPITLLTAFSVPHHYSPHPYPHQSLPLPPLSFCSPYPHHPLCPTSSPPFALPPNHPLHPFFTIHVFGLKVSSFGRFSQ